MGSNQSLIVKLSPRRYIAI